MEHPYKKFEGSLLWKLVDNSIDKLSNNSDIVEQTKREYIVGLICSEICNELFISPSTTNPKSSIKKNK